MMRIELTKSNPITSYTIEMINRQGVRREWRVDARSSIAAQAQLLQRDAEARRCYFDDGGKNNCVVAQTKQPRTRSRNHRKR